MLFLLLVVVPNGPLCVPFHPADDTGPPSTTNTADAESHEFTVSQACSHLQKHVLPHFISKLDLMSLKPYNGALLERILHQHGINVRYLGTIAERTQLPHVRELCEVELVARTCKQVLGKYLRESARKLLKKSNIMVG